MRARTRSSLKYKGVLVLLFSIGSSFSWISVFLYFDLGALISAWVFWGLLIQAFLALVFLLVFEALIRFTSIQNIDELCSDNDVNPCFFLGSFFLWGVFRFPDVLQLAPILWDFVKKTIQCEKDQNGVKDCTTICKEWKPIPWYHFNNIEYGKISRFLGQSRSVYDCFMDGLYTHWYLLHWW